MVKMNVDLLRVIQIGLTFSDENGNQNQQQQLPHSPHRQCPHPSISSRHVMPLGPQAISPSIRPALGSSTLRSGPLIHSMLQHNISVVYLICSLESDMYAEDSITLLQVSYERDV